MSGLQQSVVGTDKTNVGYLECVPHDYTTCKVQCVQGPQWMSIQHQFCDVNHRGTDWLLHNSQSLRLHAGGSPISVSS